MADQLDFGVNWVKDFSVRRASVFMNTFLNLLFNMDYILSCRCSPALPCYAVDLVHLTFLLLRILSSHDFKKIKRLTFGYKKRIFFYRARHRGVSVVGRDNIWLLRTLQGLRNTYNIYWLVNDKMSLLRCCCRTLLLD